MTLRICLHLTIFVVEVTDTLRVKSLRPKGCFQSGINTSGQTVNYVCPSSNHFQASLSSEDGAFCSPDGLSTSLTPQSGMMNRTPNLQGIKRYQHAYCPDHSQLDLQTTVVTDKAENEL